MPDLVPTYTKPALYGLGNETREYLSRQSSSSDVNNATLYKLSALINAWKAASVWDLMGRVDLYIGNSLTAALVPVKKAPYDSGNINVNLVAGDYSEATGITLATGKYIKTGVIPSFWGPFSGSFSLGIAVAPDATDRMAYGVISNPSAFANLRASSSLTDARLNLEASGPSDGNPASSGFHTVSRLANNDCRIFRNTSQLVLDTASKTWPSPSFGTHDVWVGTRNDVGTANAVNVAQIGARITFHFVYTKGITSAELSSIYTPLTVFMSGIGRSLT